MERLQKVLANAGVASRRKAEELILEGRVKVNGQSVTQLGTKIDPAFDRVEVDGRQVQLVQKKLYYLFYKPTGVITSVRDPQGRTVVLDYFKDVAERIYPVGRLDRDTSGLLLLTNDGALVHHLLHPSFELKKEYLATVQGRPQASQIQALASGVHLRDGWTAPAEVELIAYDQAKQQAQLRIIIHEGRNRQVRRMCQAIGHPVLKLHRAKFDFLTLTGLKPGQSRPLTLEEIKRLKERSHNLHN